MPKRIIHISVFFLIVAGFPFTGMASPVFFHDHSRACLDTLTEGGAVAPDNREHLSVSSKNEKPHSPHKATIMAMALPGLGQIYNRDWYKLPILYGGIGGVLYALDWNTKTYKRYRDAFVGFTGYMGEKVENPDIPYPTINDWDKVLVPGQTAEKYEPKRFQDILKDRKNRYKRDRDLMYIVTAGVYALQILDATVFAHFYGFKMDEDLSMQIKPSTNFDFGTGASVGLSLTLTF